MSSHFFNLEEPSCACNAIWQNETRLKIIILQTYFFTKKEMLSSFKSLKSSPEVFFIKLGCLFDRAITSLAQLQASFDINFLTTRTRTHPFLHLSLEVGEAGEEHRWTLAKNSFLLLLPLDASVWSNNGFMKSSLRHKTKVMKYKCFFFLFFKVTLYE